jgi:hypothetical protein
VSTNPKQTVGLRGLADPKAIEFISKLKAKTAQGKVTWEKFDKDIGFYARLPEGILAYFQSTATPPWEWKVFGVQMKDKLIFHVPRTVSDMILMMAPEAADPVQKEAHELFQLIASKQVNPLDKALSSLDQL